MSSACSDRQKHPPDLTALTAEARAALAAWCDQYAVLRGLPDLVYVFVAVDSTLLHAPPPLPSPPPVVVNRPARPAAPPASPRPSPKPRARRRQAPPPPLPPPLPPVEDTPAEPSTRLAAPPHRCLPSPPSPEVLHARVHGLTYKQIKGPQQDALIRRYQAGDRNAGELLVIAHRKLIEHFAALHGRSGRHDLSQEDLYAEAQIGFLKGVARYDFTKKVNLSTYVTHWIRAAVNRAKLDGGHTIRVPVYLHDKNTEAMRGADDPRILAKHRALTMLRLDEQASAHHTYTVGDTVPDEQPTPEERLRAELDKVRALQIFREAGLTEREDVIARHRIMADEPLTLQEVADQFGLSRERIRQLEVLAIRKLRRAATLLDAKDAPAPIAPIPG